VPSFLNQFDANPRKAFKGDFSRFLISFTLVILLFSSYIGAQYY
jgi:hypothetical protein